MACFKEQDRADALTSESYRKSKDDFRIHNWFFLDRIGDSTVADELIGVLGGYDKTPNSQWEKSSPFTTDYLEGISKAITSPSTIAFERYFCESSRRGRVLSKPDWRECEETMLIGRVKNAVKVFCENAGAVAKIVESPTLRTWSDAVRVLNETCYGHQEDCCTQEQAKAVVGIIAENTPRLAADVRIWRLANNNDSEGRTNSSEGNVTIVGNNNVVGPIKGSRIETGNSDGRQKVRWLDALKIGWVKLLVAILGLFGLTGGGLCIYVKIYENDRKSPDTQAIPSAQIYSNQNANVSADQLAGNAGKFQFVNCTVNINFIQQRTDVSSIAAGKSRMDGGFLNAVSDFAQDVGISTNGWPLLRNPKGLDVVVQQMEDSLTSENAEKAILMARIAERIIDQHWKAYTNGSLSVTRDFAANVSRTYVTLAQDALSRNDYPAAKQCCDIAVQFLGKKIPANVRALQIACAIRFGDGVFLCFDLCSMAQFKERIPKEELYEVFNHLAQWGYLVPYFIDFDAKRLLQISYEKSFNFDNPLKYAFQIQLAGRTKEGQEVKSNIILNQWKGFDKYETVDVHRWFRDMIKQFGDDPVVRERTRIYETLKARGLPEI